MKRPPAAASTKGRSVKKNWQKKRMKTKGEEDRRANGQTETTTSKSVLCERSLLASEQLFRLIYLALINLIKRRWKRTIISLKLGGNKIST
jgi:hypothetical protein